MPFLFLFPLIIFGGFWRLAADEDRQVALTGNDARDEAISSSDVAAGIPRMRETLAVRFARPTPRH